MPVFDFMKQQRIPSGEGDRQLVELSVDEIVPNPSQPRITFDDEGIAELAQSIRQVGLIQPLVVRRLGAGYELVAGERRLRAVKSLGFDKVSCIIQNDVENETSAMMALIENLQREDLHYLEEGQCYEDLIMRYALTQEELASRLGKSQSSIANKLRLLKLPAAVKAKAIEVGLTERHARALLRLRGEKEQLQAIARITERGMSVKETERMVEKTLNRLYDERADGARPRPMAFRLVKDYRLFMNTVNAAVNLLREGGMVVEVEQTDIEGGVDIRIRVMRGKT